MKTIREAKANTLTLRLVRTEASYVGLIFAADRTEKVRLTGSDADDLWRRLHDEAAKLDPRYLGFDGARARFLHFFPGGFGSAHYAGRERDYKVAAKAKLDAAAAVEAAASGSGFGEAALAAFRGTNLLSPFEKPRLTGLLRGPQGDAFVRAAARFALGDPEAGLRDMERAAKPHDCAMWTVMTYLPFLWRPDAHMFLKPEVTKDFAARVGHRFAADYQPRLDLSVYDSLLDLVATSEREIADLQPRDRIDVQSFVWVIGAYKESDRTVPAA